jgi:hypothetical protein
MLSEFLRYCVLRVTPCQRGDKTGHVDGMARFTSEDLMFYLQKLINACPKNEALSHRNVNITRFKCKSTK